jgi:two-component system response regulator NreC
MADETHPSANVPREEDDTLRPPVDPAAGTDGAQLLPAILQGAPIGVFCATFDTLKSANAMMARLFGYTDPEEMIATPSMPSCLFIDPRRYRQALRKAKVAGQPLEGEEHFRRKDGSAFVARLRLQPVLVAENRPGYYGGYITESAGPRPTAAEVSEPAGGDGSPAPAEAKSPVAKPKLLIVDDHAMLRRGLRETLASKQSIEVVGEAGTGKEAIALARDLKPDVILMDVHLPEMTGLQASREILKTDAQTKIIVFSSDTSRASVDEALMIGVRGYLSKMGFGDELNIALESVMSGHLYLSPSASEGILTDYRKSLLGETPGRMPLFSERDKQLLQLIASGRRSKEIGELLQIRTKSVEAYRSRLIKKVGVSSSTELVRYAAERGLLKS